MAQKNITIEELQSKIFNSKHYGKFIILNEEPRLESSPYLRRVKIKFLNTGHEKVVQLGNALLENVRDDNSETVNKKVYDLTPVLHNIYDTINNGKLEIIEDYGYTLRKKQRMVKVKFLDTGYETICRLTSVLQGYVKDIMRPKIYGVGYYGTTDTVRYDPIERIIYNRWNSMLARCYNPTTKGYNRYGAIGIKVCDRWLNFNNFRNDVKMFYGYDFFINNPNNYQLDKDYLQLIFHKNTRVYSPDTCIWLDIYSNILLSKITSTQYNGVVIYDNEFYSLIFNAMNCSLLFYGPFIDAESAARFFNNTLHHISISSRLPICQSPGIGNIIFKKKEMCHIIS